MFDHNLFIITWPLCCAARKRWILKRSYCQTERYLGSNICQTADVEYNMLEETVWIKQLSATNGRRALSQRIFVFMLRFVITDVWYGFYSLTCFNVKSIEIFLRLRVSMHNYMKPVRFGLACLFDNKDTSFFVYALAKISEVLSWLCRSRRAVGRTAKTHIGANGGGS